MCLYLRIFLLATTTKKVTAPRKHARRTQRPIMIGTGGPLCCEDFVCLDFTPRLVWTHSGSEMTKATYEVFVLVRAPSFGRAHIVCGSMGARHTDINTIDKREIAVHEG